MSAASRPEPRPAPGRVVPVSNRIGRSEKRVWARGRGERGLILLVVLIMVILLAILTAGFTFSVRSNLSGVYARQQQFQARIAAESGIQRAILQLRKSRDDPANWYDNRGLYRQAALEKDNTEAAFQQTGQGSIRGASPATPEPTKEEGAQKQAEPMWRFTLYAVNHDDEQNPAVRYGITPETSKLDLNLANEEQLRYLIETVVPEFTPTNQSIDRESLVQCLLDWREKGENARPKGAKSEYYRSLRPGYQPKLGRFDTVEELLLVKGFSGWVLYGEDYNRNGLLDQNEDDGNASFPPDNADGKLYRGLAPYLTVFSRELNTDSSNKPRINLNMKDTVELQKQLTERNVDARLVDYIMRIREGGKAFRSVMDLLPVPPPEPEATTQPGDEEGDGTTTQPGDEPTSPPTSQPTSQSTSKPSGSSGSGRQPTSRPTSRRSGRQDDVPLANLTDEIPPGQATDLPVILDRLTTDVRPVFVGRINVAVAPREVLATLPELSTTEIDAIASNRGGLSGDDKRTPAWLLTQGLVSERKFRKLLPKLTASSSTFSVDAVGFGDHVGVTKRIGAVIEMRGPIGQVLYYRDLTPLGPAYTPHGEETRSVVRESNR